MISIIVKDVRYTKKWMCQYDSAKMQSILMRQSKSSDSDGIQSFLKYRITEIRQISVIYALSVASLT